MLKILSTPYGESDRIEAFDGVMAHMRGVCRRIYGLESDKLNVTGEERFLHEIRKIVKEMQEDWPWSESDINLKASYILSRMEQVIMDNYDDYMDIFYNDYMDVFLPERSPEYLFRDALRYASAENNFSDIIKDGFEKYKYRIAKVFNIKPDDILFEEIAALCDKDIKRFNEHYEREKASLAEKFSDNFVLVLENSSEVFDAFKKYFEKDKEYSDEKICQVLGKYIFNHGCIIENAEMPKVPQGTRKIFADAYRCIDFEHVGESIRESLGLKAGTNTNLPKM